MYLTQIYRNISRIVLVSVILGAAALFVILNKAASGVKPIDQRVAAAPQDVNLRVEAAKELERKGKIGEAREQILTALDFDPSNPWASGVYREITAKSANLESDVETIKKILVLRPDYQKAWAKLATLYEYQGKDNLADEARQKSGELAKKL